jgi:hypothetical protein
VSGTEITEPLRLAVGSHVAGSGKGCAMNVISWENGDKNITDMPACSDPLLARIVQRVNDAICTHRDGDLLCASCSLAVLELGHLTVGTGAIPLTALERHRVWVKVAADQARQVLHIVSQDNKAASIRAIESAERWAEYPTDENRKECAAAAAAAYAAAHAYAAAYAAHAVAHAVAAYAAHDAAAAAAYAAYAAHAHAAHAYAHAVGAVGGSSRRLARRAIDLFISLTGHVTPEIKPEETACAVSKMLQHAN